MSSLIPCPHCGPRAKEEFTIRGAALDRPAAEASAADWMDYVYLRDNPRGDYAELWHHTSGCRRWLVVTRHTVTHEIFSCRDTVLAAGDTA